MTARDLDATHAAAVAAERHADLRTRFAVALAPAVHPKGTATKPGETALEWATRLYDLAEALATEDARRREADGVK